MQPLLMLEYLRLERLMRFTYCARCLIASQTLGAALLANLDLTFAQRVSLRTEETFRNHS
jgi:hypothetical protein